MKHAISGKQRDYRYRPIPVSWNMHAATFVVADMRGTGVQTACRRRTRLAEPIQRDWTARTTQRILGWGQGAGLLTAVQPGRYPTIASSSRAEPVGTQRILPTYGTQFAIVRWCCDVVPGCGGQ
jgi:hypothetical protein